VPLAMILGLLAAEYWWKWSNADEIARSYSEFWSLDPIELPYGYWQSPLLSTVLVVELGRLLIRRLRRNPQLVLGPVAISSSFTVGFSRSVHRGRVTEVRLHPDGVIGFAVPDGLSLQVDGEDLVPVPGGDTPEEIARMCAGALAVPLVKVRKGGGKDVIEGEHLRSTRLTLTELEASVQARGDLSGVDISHLDYKGLDFSGLRLVGATLRRPTKPDPSEARPDAWDRVVFDGADLTGADLQWARLNGASMSGAKLVGARLVGADLRGADLRRADLSGADLDGALLDGADLSGVVWDETTRWSEGFVR
jgi:hypothetical protein